MCLRQQHELQSSHDHKAVYDLLGERKMFINLEQGTLSPSNYDVQSFMTAELSKPVLHDTWGLVYRRSDRTPYAISHSSTEANKVDEPHNTLERLQRRSMAKYIESVFLLIRVFMRSPCSPALPMRLFIVRP